MLGEMLGDPAAVDPEQQVDPFVNARRIDLRLVVSGLWRQMFDQLLVGQHRGVIENVVVQYIVANGQQVDPVARFGNFQQTTFVHILIFQPDQRLVDRRPVVL